MEQCQKVKVVDELLHLLQEDLQSKSSFQNSGIFSVAQRGETDNSRRLDFVCYKHALIRFINRFTWKRIQVWGGSMQRLEL